MTLPGDLYRAEMVREILLHLFGRLPAEAAIGAEPEVREEAARDGVALLEAVHRMDQAEIDKRIADREVGERRRSTRSGPCSTRPMSAR